MCYGGVVEDGEEGKMRYNGGSRKCMLMQEGMGVEELRKMIRETVGVGVEVDRMWYSLKYDRNMIMAVEGNTDVRMIFKGNDEYSYVYVSNKESVVPCVSKNVNGTMGAGAGVRLQEVCNGPSYGPSTYTCVEPRRFSVYDRPTRGIIFVF